MDKNRKRRVCLLTLSLAILTFITSNLAAGTTPTLGQLPRVGDKAPAFILTNTDLQDVSLADFSGYNLVLNIFPSVDTPVCAASLRRFNEHANNLPGTKVLAISMDLPFAMKRHCAAIGLDDIIPLSAFRSPSFGEDYGVLIPATPMKGLLARAVVVIDREGKVLYNEFVFDINNEPDYDKAIAALPDMDEVD